MSTRTIPDILNQSGLSRGSIGLPPTTGGASQMSRLLATPSSSLSACAKSTLPGPSASMSFRHLRAVHRSSCAARTQTDRGGHRLHLRSCRSIALEPLFLRAGLGSASQRQEAWSLPNPSGRGSAGRPNPSFYPDATYWATWCTAVANNSPAARRAYASFLAIVNMVRALKPHRPSNDVCQLSDEQIEQEVRDAGRGRGLGVWLAAGWELGMTGVTVNLIFDGFSVL